MFLANFCPRLCRGIFISCLHLKVRGVSRWHFIFTQESIYYAKKDMAHLEPIIPKGRMMVRIYHCPVCEQKKIPTVAEAGLVHHFFQYKRYAPEEDGGTVYALRSCTVCDCYLEEKTKKRYWHHAFVARFPCKTWNELVAFSDSGYEHVSVPTKSFDATDNEGSELEPT